MSKSMTHEIVNGIFVIAHGPATPSDEDWDALLRSYASVDAGDQTIRSLVFARGGPNAMQRARLNAAIGGRGLRVAVFLGSPVVRGIMMAFGWMARFELKGLAPGDHAGAFAYLGVANALQPELLEHMRARNRELGFEV